MLSGAFFDSRARVFMGSLAPCQVACLSHILDKNARASTPIAVV